MTDPAMQRLLEKAKEMQADQNKRLAEAVIQRSVADDQLEATMNGHRAITSLRVDPELIDPDRKAELEGHFIELVNSLVDEMDQILEKRFGIVDKMPSLTADNIFRR